MPAARFSAGWLQGHSLHIIEQPRVSTEQHRGNVDLLNNPLPFGSSVHGPAPLNIRRPMAVPLTFSTDPAMTSASMEVDRFLPLLPTPCTCARVRTQA